MNGAVTVLLLGMESALKVYAPAAFSLVVCLLAGLTIHFSAMLYPVPSSSDLRRRSFVAIIVAGILIIAVLGAMADGLRFAHLLGFSLPPFLLILYLASLLQRKMDAAITTYGDELTAPVKTEIGAETTAVKTMESKLAELQDAFTTMNKRFNFVRSFGSSLRFEVAWQDIQNGTQSMLGAMPVLHLPRLPGSIPNGFFPFVENGNDLFVRQEWVEALSGKRMEAADDVGRRLLWIPLELGDGQRVIVHLNLAPTVPNDAVEIFSTQLNLLLEKMRLYNEIELQSRTDLMTGLAHHAAFKNLLHEEMERSRQTDRPLSLLMCDVDFFKQVNDVHGHLVGDQVLIQIAKRIRDMVRISDSVSRYGGEEFAVILPETGIVGAKEIAERIRVQVESNPIVARTETEEKTLRKTISIGVASTPPLGKSPGELISSADSALYRAKRGGRNKVVTCTEQ